jgi:YD repeat-containing protein
MHQKPQPAGLLDEDQAAREQDYDALARFVSRRMTPEQSVLDAWTLAAADAGEATITTRLLDPAAAQGAATRGAASGLRR